MPDVLHDDSDNEAEGTVTSLTGKKNAKNAAPMRKRKSKKRATREDSSSEASGDQDGDDGDDDDDDVDVDGDEDDDDDDCGSNRRSRSPLPYSAPKVDYIFVSQNVRRAVPRSTGRHRKVRAKKSSTQAVPPQGEGKNYFSTIVRVAY